MNLRNWINNSRRSLPVFVLVLLITGMANNAQAQQSALDKLTQKFEQGAVFRAFFKHESIDSYTKDTVAREGQIWIAKDKYKISTSNQSVVVNGKTSMVYDDNRNRVIISKYDPSEDDFAPSRILNGIDSTFTVASEKKKDHQIYVKLTSDDPFAIYKKVEIYLSKKWAPHKIRAVDPVDNIITTTFRNGKFIRRGDKLFMLDYPNGAKIVDMRQ